MKILVAFYSRHNNTQIIAERISKILGADIEEIIDLKDRKNIETWQDSSFDENLRTPTKIAKIKNNPQDYDLIIIGTPIWDGITPAARTYLKNNKFKKVAFFATFGAAAEDAFYIMEKLTKNKPLATLEVQDRQIVAGEHKLLVKEFCNKIKNKIN